MSVLSQRAVVDIVVHTSRPTLSSPCRAVIAHLLTLARRYT